MPDLSTFEELLEVDLNATIIIVSTGNRMNSSAIWGNIIARAIIIGTEIARAAASAIWPIACAILPQLHENPCDYLLIIIYRV